MSWKSEGSANVWVFVTAGKIVSGWDNEKCFSTELNRLNWFFLIVAMVIIFLTSGRWYVFGHAWREESNRMPPGATTILVGVTNSLKIMLDRKK